MFFNISLFYAALLPRSLPLQALEFGHWVKINGIFGIVMWGKLMAKAPPSSTLIDKSYVVLIAIALPWSFICKKARQDPFCSWGSKSRVVN